jgi:hypothetical protein
LDDTDFYAPARFLTEMLQGDWIENFRTSGKYNKQWCKDFITQLMKSEHNSQIGRTRIFPWLTSTDPHDCISKGIDLYICPKYCTFAPYFIKV